MELFDKLSDTIVSVSKDATQKAKNISDIARLRMEIRSKKEYIRKLYTEIGRFYYEAHKDDAEREFDDQMALIKDSLEVLEELHKQLGQIKGTLRCDKCGQDMPIGADYCSKCGAKLDKGIFEEDTDSAFETEQKEADIIQMNTADAAQAGSDAVQADGAQTDSAVQADAGDAMQADPAVQADDDAMQADKPGML